MEMFEKLNLEPENLAFVIKAFNYAKKAHRKVNQKYDNQDYFDTHVLLVLKYCLSFLHILPHGKWHIAIAIALLHDCIEDCRLTFNDIKNNFGVEVAEGVYALSNEKGRTRAERANAKYYRGIRNTNLAIYVKLCDRMANVFYSKNAGSSMFKTYQKEDEHFVSALKGTLTLFGKLSYKVKFLFGYTEVYEPLFHELSMIMKDEDFETRFSYVDI